MLPVHSFFLPSWVGPLPAIKLAGNFFQQKIHFLLKTGLFLTGGLVPHFQDSELFF